MDGRDNMGSHSHLSLDGIPGLPHLLGTGRRAYAWIKGYRATSGPPWPGLPQPGLWAGREIPSHPILRTKLVEGQVTCMEMRDTECSM